MTYFDIKTEAEWKLNVSMEYKELNTCYKNSAPLWTTEMHVYVFEPIQCCYVMFVGLQGTERTSFSVMKN